jgi:tetratricopeptide (TPR) repeat protein
MLKNFKELSTDEQRYLLEELAYHLYAAKQWGRLYALISMPWMQLKKEETSTHRSFFNDVELAVRAAENQEPFDFVNFVRLNIIQASVSYQINRLPDPIWEAFIRAGRKELAYRLAEGLVDPPHQARVFQTFSKTLMEGGDILTSQEYHRKAMQAANLIPEWKDRASSLLELGEGLLARQATEQGLPAFFTAVSELPLQAELHGGHLGYVYYDVTDDSTIELLIKLGDVSVLCRVLTAFEELMENQYDPANLAGFDRIWQTLIALGASNQARESARRMLDRIIFPEDRVYEWQNPLNPIIDCLTRVLDRTGLERALSETARYSRFDNRLDAQVKIAASFLELGDTDQARKVAQNVLETTISMGSNIDTDDLLTKAVNILGTTGIERLWIEIASTEDDELLEDLTKVLGERLAQAADSKGMWKLLNIIEKSTSEKYQEISLWHLQMSFIKANELGPYEKAYEMMEKIEQKRFDSQEWKTYVDKQFLISVRAKYLIKSGKLDKIEAVIEEAKSIYDPDDQDVELGEISELLTDAGHYDLALNALREIPGASWRNRILLEIAPKILSFGDSSHLKRLLSIVESFKTEEMRAECLGHISLILARIGRIEDAAKLIDQVLALETIDDNEVIGNLLSKIAKALLEMGKQAKAQQVLSYAMAMKETLKSFGISTRDLIHILVLCGDVDNLERILEEFSSNDPLGHNRTLMLDLIKDAMIERGDTGERDSILEALAIRPGSEGALALAELGFVEAAINRAEALEHDSHKVSALLEIAEFLVYAGDEYRAVEASRKAEMIARSKGGTYICNQAASALLKTGQSGPAREMAHRALREVQNEDNGLDDSILAPNELPKTIRILHDLGDKEAVAGALQLVRLQLYGQRPNTQLVIDTANLLAEVGKTREAIDLILQISELTPKVLNLLEIAEKIYPSMYSEILEMIVPMINNIQKQDEHVRALAELAHYQALEGQRESAVQMLKRAMSLAGKVSRNALFEVIAASVPAFAALSRGETIWDISQVVIEQQWWMPAESTAGNSITQDENSFDEVTRQPEETELDETEFDEITGEPEETELDETENEENYTIEVDSHKYVANTFLITFSHENIVQEELELQYVDPYAVRELGYHLYKAGDLHRLYSLLLSENAAWKIWKKDLLENDQSYIGNLNRAIKGIDEPFSSQKLLNLTQLYTARQIVVSGGFLKDPMSKNVDEDRIGFTQALIKICDTLMRAEDSHAQPVLDFFIQHIHSMRNMQCGEITANINDLVLLLLKNANYQSALQNANYQSALKLATEIPDHPLWRNQYRAIAWCRLSEAIAARVSPFEKFTAELLAPLVSPSWEETFRQAIEELCQIPPGRLLGDLTIAAEDFAVTLSSSGFRLAKQAIPIAIHLIEREPDNFVRALKVLRLYKRCGWKSVCVVIEFLLFSQHRPRWFFKILRYVVKATANLLSILGWNEARWIAAAAFTPDKKRNYRGLATNTEAKQRDSLYTEIRTLAYWKYSLDQLADGSANNFLKGLLAHIDDAELYNDSQRLLFIREVVRIAAWSSSMWRQVYQILITTGKNEKLRRAPEQKGPFYWQLRESRGNAR